MSFIINNYLLLIALGVIALALGLIIYDFIKASDKERKEKILTVLVNLTFIAEKTLGEKTGSLKRSQVYNQFKKLCPFLASFVSMETFDTLLDEAIAIMEETVAKKQQEG